MKQVLLKDDVRRYQVRITDSGNDIPTIGWDTLSHSDWFSETGEFATFQRKMQSWRREELAKALEEMRQAEKEVEEDAKAADEKKARCKVVSREINFWTMPKGVPNLTEEEKKIRLKINQYKNQNKPVPPELLEKLKTFPIHPEDSETKLSTETLSFDDGTTKEILLSIENPRGVYIHKYRDNLYKVVTSPTPLSFGTDWQGKPLTGKRAGTLEKPTEERFQNNLSRARISVEEYGLCNDWDWFVTLTLDPEKGDRTDLEVFRERLVQMILNLRKRQKIDIAFLLVPEPHPRKLEGEDVATWHFHGLLKVSDPKIFFSEFVNKKIYGREKNKLPPEYIRKKLKKGEKMYHWLQYDKNFGYNVIEPVLSVDASTRYLLKYMRKEQGLTAKSLESGKHLYFHSRGLKRAEKISAECLPDIQHRGTKQHEKHYETCIVSWFKM